MKKKAFVIRDLPDEIGHGSAVERALNPIIVIGISIAALVVAS